MTGNSNKSSARPHLGKEWCGLQPGQQRCPVQFNDVRINTMTGNYALPPGVTKLHSIILCPCLLPEGHEHGHLSDARYGSRIRWMVEPREDRADA